MEANWKHNFNSIMTVDHIKEQLFIEHLTEVVTSNITNDKFGVSELASQMSMSRSHLHRQVKSITNQSVSQFICKIRLEIAMEMLQENSDSASEVAYNVGFSSPSYFSRCFHNYYGFPPGEVKNRNVDENIDEEGATQINPKQLKAYPKHSVRPKVILFTIIGILAIAIAFISYAVYINGGFLPAHLISNRDLSIIVLPFENLSDNPDNVSFADGIREDILNNLYWITALRVVSRTSAEQFRATNLSATEIAKKMNVHYVLEGSVRRNGDQVRISAQLIDAVAEDHLWSANFDRELDDIIGIQDEIALQVASRLKTVLSKNERRKIEKISTQNPKAYEYFLQARFLHHKTTSELRSGFDKAGVMNCLKYFEMAIAEDEKFAEAYAGLAMANFNLTAWGFIPTNEGFIKAQELSRKALELDQECAEAHAVLGAYLVWAVRELEEGGKELQTAVRLNPNLALARQMYAQFLMITGPIEEARKQVNFTLNLEPNFWVVHNLNSWIYYFEEKYNEALESCITARDYNPNFSSNEWLFVLNYAKLGEGEKMVQHLQQIAQRYSGSEQYTQAIHDAYSRSGIEGLFQWMINVNKNSPIQIEGLNGQPFYIAWWNAILGNEEEAVLWLEKNMQQKRIPWHYFNLIATNPDFDALRENPRFLKIVDDIGLTPYDKRRAK